MTATLVELDPSLAERAATTATAEGLDGVDIRCADAGHSTAYGGALPADLVLLCGVFGNVSDDDVRLTVRALPQFCRSGALVVWTRHRRPPDLTPHIRSWLGVEGFEEQAFVAPDDALFSVGAHRFLGSPVPLELGARLFTFLRDPTWG